MAGDAARIADGPGHDRDSSFRCVEPTRNSRSAKLVWSTRNKTRSFHYDLGARDVGRDRRSAARAVDKWRAIMTAVLDVTREVRPLLNDRGGDRRPWVKPWMRISTSSRGGYRSAEMPCRSDTARRSTSARVPRMVLVLEPVVWRTCRRLTREGCCSSPKMLGA